MFKKNKLLIGEESTERISSIKIGALVFLIFQSESFVSHLLGLNVNVGRWLYAGLMLFSVYLMLIKRLKTGVPVVGKLFYFPAIVFTIFFIISANSAFFLFPKPLKDWLPSLYIFMSIFIFYFLYVFNYSITEVVMSIAIVSILVAILLITDKITNLSILDEYQRISTFFFDGKRRIVILKNEIVFGFIIFVSLYISGEKIIRYPKVWLILAAILFLVQTFIMESRMAFMAMGVGFISLLQLKGFTKKVSKIYVVSLVLAIVVFPFVFAEYIDRLSKMSLFDDQSNIFIRYLTISYYFDLFIQSNWFGIGMMSRNASVNNILQSTFFNIADAGLFSALFMFGLPGLCIWGWGTFRSIHVFKKYNEIKKKKDAFSAAMYAFLMSMTISILPLSIFTQSWCINTGGIVLYLAWLHESSLLQTSMRRQP